MRLKSTRSLKKGEILAQPIYNERGHILIQRNMHLTTTMIKRLIKQGVTYVYVRDDRISSVDIDPVLPNELRVRATQTISDTFDYLKENSIVEKSYILENKANKLNSVVKDLVTEMKSKDEAISLLTDILISDDYTF